MLCYCENLLKIIKHTSFSDDLSELSLADCITSWYNAAKNLWHAERVGSKA